MLLETVGSKAPGFAAQLFLARLLEPKDFGLVAIACMVLAIPSMLRQSGTGMMLVPKGILLEGWATPMFWLGIAPGVVTTAAMLALGPWRRGPQERGWLRGGAGGSG